MLLLIIFLLGNIISINALIRNCTAEFCDPSHEPYANIVFVMKGYNILTGNPFVSGGIQDPGFRTSFIFSPTVKDEDSRYTLHSGITASKEEVCSLSEDTKIVTTVKGYRDAIQKFSRSGKSFTSSVETEITAQIKFVELKTKANPLIDLSFSASEDFDTNEEFFTKLQGVLSIKQGICISYSVMISTYTPPPFTPQFKEALKRLSEAITKDQQKEEFKKFIDEFGTHYLKQCAMGARMAVTRRYSQKEFKKTNYAKLKKCSSERFKLSLLNGPNGGKDSEECSSTELDGSSDQVEDYDREYITSYGSKPGESIMEWANQKFDAPLPVKMELSPIINLFTKAHFSRDDDIKNITIENILKWFLPLYYKYCDNFKSDLGIKSCDPPKERCGLNDNCIPGEEVCYDKEGDSGYKCCRPQCKLNPCENGGKCTDTLDIRCDFTCHCTNEWSGKHCDKRVVVEETLKRELKNELTIRDGVNHEEFASKFFLSLALDYPEYTFVVDSYNAVSGYENHAYRGVEGRVTHFFREGGRNIVVGWKLKESPLESFMKTDIKNKLESDKDLKNRGHLLELADAIARKLQEICFECDVRLVHVIRKPSNLHSCGDDRWIIKYETDQVNVVIFLGEHM